MRILLVVNASASSVTARGRVIIQKALSADHDVTVAETTRRGNATRLAQNAAAAGTDVVVALGGDGTLNETANGLVGTDCALAALPGGSTNVFARTLGLPNDPVEATVPLLDALERGSIKRVGLGTVNGRYFLFHTGVGFDAAVVERVEKRGSLKRYAGHPLFIWASLATWATGYDRRHPHFQVRYPDGTTIDDGYFTIVQKTDPYSFLGNRAMHTSGASLDTPLTALTLRSLKLPTMLGVLGSAFGVGGPLGNRSKVDHREALHGLTITSQRPVPYQVDGDHLGETTSLEFRYEPDAIRLVMP